jgi:hypothetical protein
MKFCPSLDALWSNSGLQPDEDNHFGARASKKGVRPDGLLLMSSVILEFWPKNGRDNQFTNKQHILLFASNMCVVAEYCTDFSIDTLTAVHQVGETIRR